MNGKKSKKLRKLAYERATIVGKKYIWETQENNKGKSFTNVINKQGTIRSILSSLKRGINK